MTKTRSLLVTDSFYSGWQQEYLSAQGGVQVITNSQIEDCSRADKRLKKDLGITHSEALERLSKEAGFYKIIIR